MRIDHLGTSFEINTDVPDEHLQQLKTMVQSTLAEVRKTNPNSTPLQQAIIALYQIADTCTSLEQQHSTMASQLDQAAKITDSILLNISDVI